MIYFRIFLLFLELLNSEKQASILCNMPWHISSTCISAIYVFYAAPHFGHALAVTQTVRAEGTVRVIRRRNVSILEQLQVLDIHFYVR